jgi:ABC-type bacteriocin/lantibiotic exporter with double-glycine peptidase domain
MGTDGRGTSLKALAAAARRRGFTARGLRLTQAALFHAAADERWPALPGNSPQPHHPTPSPPRSPYLIALLRPGHYVLVEQVREEAVTVWDPDGRGLHQAGVKEYSWEAWGRAWNGVVLAL